MAWVGFDLVLATFIVATGVGIVRGRAWLQGVASATATLLGCDAWFDVLGASTGGARSAALALAFGAEVPLALLCVFVASRAEARERLGREQP